MPTDETDREIRRRVIAEAVARSAVLLAHRNAAVSVVSTADVPPAPSPELAAWYAATAAKLALNPPPRPFPAIGGVPMRWVCEFCFAMSASPAMPSSWDLVLGSAVCLDCHERVEADGGYSVVKGGAYADGPDPRSP